MFRKGNAFKSPNALASRIQKIRKCPFQETGDITCQGHQAAGGMQLGFKSGASSSLLHPEPTPRSSDALALPPGGLTKRIASSPTFFQGPEGSQRHRTFSANARSVPGKLEWSPSPLHVPAEDLSLTPPLLPFDSDHLSKA